MDENTARVIGAALEAASYRLRGVAEDEKLDSIIRDVMDARDVSKSDFGSVSIIVSMLLGFADAVRVADRNGETIIPMLGEKRTPKSR
ncbi:hypothetical protein [Methylopila sp. 73B]|uniref:hypothetical protein n=1 Tax=Methylopila sp. 73B TaxID=1120792 RepID=UPI0012DFB431|nr:hypothetical protein [Methylopila sp. 73B]